jgi:hypothetical protein
MTKARRTDLGLVSELPEEKRRNWHRRITQWWMDVYSPPPGVNDAEQLLKDRDRFKPHVFRALALDLMCESFPEGHPPPEPILKLMKAALDLPEDHELGGWAVHPWRSGNDVLPDGRGSPDRNAQDITYRIDCEYFQTHSGRWLSYGKLAKQASSELGRKISTASLRAWRKQYREWVEFGGWYVHPEK